MRHNSIRQAGRWGQSGILLLVGGGLLLAGCSRSVTLNPAVAENPAPQPAAEKPHDGEQGATKAVGEGFQFPKDQGGRLLSQLLVPSPQVLPATETESPHRFPRPTGLEEPTLPLPPGEMSVPRLPVAKEKIRLQPGPLPEGVPLVSSLATPPRPEVPQLAVGDRVRLPSVDVNQPPPLPLLAQGTPDRASLDDPTSEFSQAAALAATLPERTTPAPFLRLTLPEPFENRQTVKLRHVPAEDGTPVAAASRSTKP